MGFLESTGFFGSTFWVELNRSLPLID